MTFLPKVKKNQYYKIVGFDGSQAFTFTHRKNECDDIDH